MVITLCLSLSILLFDFGANKGTCFFRIFLQPNEQKIERRKIELCTNFVGVWFRLKSRERMSICTMIDLMVDQTRYMLCVCVMFIAYAYLMDR